MQSVIDFYLLNLHAAKWLWVVYSYIIYMLIHVSEVCCIFIPEYHDHSTETLQKMHGPNWIKEGLAYRRRQTYSWLKG